MSSCELCGKKRELVVAYVEGVRLRVCSDCGKYGNVIEEDIKKPEIKQVFKKEVVEIIVEDYSNIIKNAREKKNLNQKDLALKLKERESLISKIEHGGLKPDIELAKKLEKFFNVKLVLQEKVDVAASTKIKNQKLTIGDYLKK